MWRRLNLFLLGGVVLGSTAFSQGAVDFRSAAEAAGRAAVSVMVGDVVAPPVLQPGRPVDWPILREALVTAQRSGFAVGPELVIVYDVGADEVKLVTSDGSRTRGQVVVRDHVTGLAAVRVEEASLSGLTMSADRPAMGTPVLVSWLYHGKTVAGAATMIATAPQTTPSELGVTQVLDAQLYPPQIGAAVVDASGMLVGVAMLRDGVNLCLPTSDVKRLIEAAAAEEPADLYRGRLGVSLDERSGSTAVEVASNTPAEAAGLAAGDKITRINAWECKSLEDVLAAVSMLRAGDAVSVTVQREGETLEKTVTLAKVEPLPPGLIDMPVPPPVAAPPVIQLPRRPLPVDGNQLGRMQEELSRLQEKIEALNRQIQPQEAPP
jgi:S1-C subfamily serine protease